MILFSFFETWTNQTSDIDIYGYVSYNFYRKFQNRNAKRCSGGAALYFKQHLQYELEVVRTHSDTIVWLKLDKHLFHFDEDVYIGGVYIWCEDSPAYQVTDVDWFDTVQQVISDFEYIGALYIVGDWNSRVVNTRKTLFIDFRFFYL